VLAFALALWAGTPAASTARESSVTVLLLYAENRTLPAAATQDEALRTTLQAGLPSGVFFHTEYLDLAPLPAAAEAALGSPSYSARPPAIRSGSRMRGSSWRHTPTGWKSGI
jgi:hypothetical protein